jgi:hypothetical protein
MYEGGLRTVKFQALDNNELTVLVAIALVLLMVVTTGSSLDIDRLKTRVSALEVRCGGQR